MSRPYRFIFTSEGAPLKLETHLKTPMNVELCCHQWLPLSMGSWNRGLSNQERIPTTGITTAQKEIADQLSKYFRDSMELQMPHHLVVESKLLPKKTLLIKGLPCLQSHSPPWIPFEYRHSPFLLALPRRGDVEVHGKWLHSRDPCNLHPEDGQWQIAYITGKNNGFYKFEMHKYTGNFLTV